jgi:hypothetical protein
MSFGRTIQYVGRSDLVGYENQTSGEDFFNNLVFNGMTADSIGEAVAAHDETGIWSTYGSSILSTWKNIEILSFDEDSQTVTVVFPFENEETMLKWDEMYITLDWTSPEFKDFDLTYSYIERSYLSGHKTIYLD